jgi:hypothetical protein
VVEGNVLDAVLPDTVADEYNQDAEAEFALRAGDFLASVNDDESLEALEGNEVDLLVRRRNPPLLGGAPYFEAPIIREPGEMWGVAFIDLYGTVAELTDDGAIMRYNFDGEGPEICQGDIIVAVDGWPFEQERFRNTMSATLLIACSPLDSERPLSLRSSRQRSREESREQLFPLPEGDDFSDPFPGPDIDL